MNFNKLLSLIIIVSLFSCKTKVDKSIDFLPLSESIIYSIDSFRETSATSFKMRGWAFIDKKNTFKNNEYYLAIQKGKKYDLFKLENYIREDVTNHFKASKNLQLDNSGFKIHFKHTDYTFKNNVALYIYNPDSKEGYATLINNNLSRF